MPSLRDRRDDFQLLADHFVLKRRDFHCVAGIIPATRRTSIKYDWPGTIRELRNAIFHALGSGKTDLIESEDLPETITKKETLIGAGAALKERVDAFTKSLTAPVLNEYGEQFRLVGREIGNSLEQSAATFTAVEDETAKLDVQLTKWQQLSPESKFQAHKRHFHGQIGHCRGQNAEKSDRFDPKVTIRSLFVAKIVKHSAQTVEKTQNLLSHRLSRCVRL